MPEWLLRELAGVERVGVVNGSTESTRAITTWDRRPGRRVKEQADRLRVAMRAEGANRGTCTSWLSDSDYVNLGDGFRK
jgi:hypothetical protein